MHNAYAYRNMPRKTDGIGHWLLWCIKYLGGGQTQQLLFFLKYRVNHYKVCVSHYKKKTLHHILQQLPSNSGIWILKRVTATKLVCSELTNMFFQTFSDITSFDIKLRSFKSHLGIKSNKTRWVEPFSLITSFAHVLMISWESEKFSLECQVFSLSDEIFENQ